MMRFHVISIFPEMVEAASRFGIVGQAIKDGKLQVEALNPRSFTNNVHQTVDDRPFGGGDGMVMIGDPLVKAVNALKERAQGFTKVIHLSPRGRKLDDQMARQLSKETDLILIASRYGGIDQRFLNRYVDEEMSVGDYVLSGGELPALIVIDAVARHLPGVLGNEASAAEESFAQGLLEHPQYTRPREWEASEVPQALLSGDHAKIAAWRESLGILVTADRRPDLLAAATHLTRKALEKAQAVLVSLSDEERALCGLGAKDEILSNLQNELAKRPEDPGRRSRRRPGKNEESK